MKMGRNEVIEVCQPKLSADQMEPYHADVWADPTPEETQLRQERVKRFVRARDERVKTIYTPLCTDFISKSENSSFINQNIEETNVLDSTQIDRLVPYFQALANTIQTYKLTDFAVSTSHPIPKTKNKQPLIPKEETFAGNTKVIDKNGETLWFRGEGITNELHRGIDGYEPIEITNERAGAKLNSIYPAYPDSYDSRHPQKQYHKDQRRYFEKQGLPFGTHHFLRLQEQGKKNNQTAKRAARWCQTMCEDTFGGCAAGNPNRQAKGEAVRTWFEDTKETEVAVGMWYSVVEPEAFAKQQEFRRFQFSTLQVRVENQGAEPHKDGGDADNSFTCWTAHGIGAGSVDVCFPELGHRVKVLEEDVIGCRANLLDHCVSELKDPRGIITCFGFLRVWEEGGG
ncbi:hypothetical protein DL98DRAFT_625817 [Cadophora sp. DSE1049]|nr:hypothetical protein DL98DRAFT_625817 [Cadophora sp. DSE1049]